MSTSSGTGTGTAGNQANLDPDYALTPAEALTGILHYKDKAAAAIWTYSTAALRTEPFDLKPENLRLLLTVFEARANAASWGSTLMIAVNADTLPLHRNYGAITLAQVKAHVSTFAVQDRKHQNDVQIYHCLINSLSVDTIAKMQHRSSEWTINDKPSGLLYFKVLTGMFQVDTNATPALIRRRLSSLDTFMKSIPNYDIDAYFEYARAQTRMLDAHGEVAHDIVDHLWKGLLVVPDHNFSDYVRRKYADWSQEGASLTAPALMNSMSNYYRTLKDDGQWMQPTLHDQQLLAFAAQNISKEVALQVGKSTKGKGGGNSNKDKGGGGVPGGTSKSGKKGGKKDKVNYPEWRTKPPAQGESRSKVEGDKTYYWCVNHADKGLWVIHKPADCLKKKKKSNATPQAPATTIAPNTRLQLNPGSLAAIVADS